MRLPDKLLAETRVDIRRVTRHNRLRRSINAEDLIVIPIALDVGLISDN